jgi:hypothetical protein
VDGCKGGVGASQVLADASLSSEAGASMRPCALSQSRDAHGGGRQHDDGLAEAQLGVQNRAAVAGLAGGDREADSLEPVDGRLRVAVAEPR